MKQRIFFTGIVIVFFTMMIGQTANAQAYIQGGLNLANITKNSSGQTEDNNVLSTFNVGIMNRFGLSKVVDLEAGLLLTGKGSKAETYFNGGSDYVKSKFNPLYVELPVNAVFRVPLEPTASSSLFFNAGPYIAVGVGGKAKTDVKVGPLTSNASKSIEFSNDDPFTSEQDDAAYDKLKRFDYGLNIGGGFEFKKVILKINYGLGLAKINSTESNNNADDKNKYRTFSISAGIKLH